MKANAAMTELVSFRYLWKMKGSNTEPEVPKASSIFFKIIYLSRSMFYPQLAPDFTILITFVI